MSALSIMNSKKLDGENRRVNTICDVLDTLKLARDKHPGQKNNLDALCRRYEVDNSNRELHGALLDAEILADVYLAMTGGQVSMLLAADEPELAASETDEEVITDTTPRQLKVIRASEEELSEHEKMLEVVNKKSGGECVWMKS
jgi:DNA polymerase-3 subunit epsilon